MLSPIPPPIRIKSSRNRVPRRASLKPLSSISSSTQWAASFNRLHAFDAAGYAGSCALLLWRNFGLQQVEWLTVFRLSVYATSVIGVILVSLSLIYFNARARTAAAAAAIAPAH